MPDKDFEQQARAMANGFELQPRAEVWQNVRNAIQQPRRRRRLLLWWLLPLALLGGSMVLYTLSKQGHNTETANKKVVRQATNHAITSSAKQANINVAVNKSKQKDTTANAQVVSANDKIYQKQSPTSKRVADTTHSTKTHHELSAALLAFNMKREQVITATTPEKNDASTLSMATDETWSEANSDSEKMNMVTPANDSLQKVVITPTAALPTATNKKDSTVTNTSKTSHTIHSNIHWGVVAEAGVAARASSVLALAGMEKASNAPTTFPSTNGSGSTAVGTPGIGVHLSNHIQHGAAFAAGIALQKILTKKLDLFADVTYLYQSLHVTTNVYNDSLVFNNALSSSIGSFEAIQHYHFTSVFAGISWHFINTKHLQLGISAGADNLLLLAANQKINNNSINNFSRSDASQISDSTFNKSNFYTYQPSLFAGVLVNLKAGKKSIQFIPFCRYSLNRFDKRSTGSNNHLLSAGLRAVYFFK